MAARLDRLRAQSGGRDDGDWVASSLLTTEPARDAPPSIAAAVAARLPASVRGGVFDPGRRGLAVLAVAALLAALGGAWYFTAARPAAGAPPADPAPASAPGPQSPQGSGAALTGWPTAASSASASSEPIVVDVVGKVTAPGVVELPPGARVRDAIAAAGGALPGTDLTALDLASKLADGQQLFVGMPPPSGAAAQAAGGVVGGEPAGGGDSGGASSAIVNLNTATLAQLETLPGVGPVLAQHILDWRSQHGRFAAVSQLQQVSGIGASKYSALSGRVRV